MPAVRVKLKQIIPDYLVELGKKAKENKLLEKEITIEDHAIYNKLESIVVYYKMHTNLDDKQRYSQETYDSFKEMIGWLNEKLGCFRIGCYKPKLLTSSINHGMFQNPENQEPWLLELV